jgi:TolB-like protein/Tfp pilus assembly protein PilF
VSVFAELKRRNVFRVAALYLVAAWVLLQVGDLLFGLLGLPAWSNKLLFAALVLGFVPALIFSWVYELTPEGLQREHEVEHNASITAETARKLDLIVVGLLVVAIVFVAVERFTPRTATIPAATDAASEGSSADARVPAVAKSIAVLPFVNISSDTGNEYFADGLSEELLNLLAKIPDLRVVARTSAFKFKGEKIDVQEVARKLNVTHILEGGVRKAGNKVRVTAQLIKAADGYQLWSGTYDRTLDDIFVVQDDIAGEVVKALKLTLLGPPAVPRSKPLDSEAYNLALQGRFLSERLGREDLERAVEYFRRSLERDPGYAPSWAGLSLAYVRQASRGYVPAADGFRQAREAAEKALALDPRLAEAHLAMGRVQSGFDWDWAAADASILRALEIEPGSAEVLRYAGIQALNLGRWNEAIDLANKAIERDPLRPNSYNSLGRALLALNRDTEAEAAYRRALELDPGEEGGHYRLGLVLLLQGNAHAALQETRQETEEGWRLSGLALALHALGRRGESDGTLATLKSKYAGDMAYQIAEVHAFRGEPDLAFMWLELAYAQRDGGVPYIKGDRLTRTLVGDPRYKAFLRKLKLPE